MARRLDPAIETQCFRIAQEALNNVVKHAKARIVTVEVSQRDEQLHLSVRDDGVGFDVASFRERAVRGAIMGLLSMEERAALAGGGLEYQSVPGQGTEVHAWFPLEWDASPLARTYKERFPSSLAQNHCRPKPLAPILFVVKLFRMAKQSKHSQKQTFRFTAPGATAYMNPIIENPKISGLALQILP